MSIIRPDLNPAKSPIALGIAAGLLAILGGLVLAFGGPIAAAALFVAGIATLVILRDIEIGFWAVIAVVALLPFATIPVDIGLTPTFLDMALAGVNSSTNLKDWKKSSFLKLPVEKNAESNVPEETLTSNVDDLPFHKGRYSYLSN